MGVLQTDPTWWGWILGGVGLFALAQGLVWLADKIANLLGMDIPDGQYGYYASWVTAALAILVILNTTAGINLDLDFYVSILVSILTALGYDFGSEARRLKK